MIGTVVTRGYGSFSTSSLVVTAGYSQAPAVIIYYPIIEDTGYNFPWSVTDGTYNFPWELPDSGYPFYF